MNQNESASSSGRREFLKMTGLTALTTLIAGRLLTPPRAFAADAKAKVEAVKPTDAMAVTLGYQEDAKKVDTKKWPKRAGAAGAKQFCYNCNFYKYADASKSSKSAEAPCQIFGGKLVKSHGWCNTWNQNAAVKD